MTDKTLRPGACLIVVDIDGLRDAWPDVLSDPFPWDECSARTVNCFSSDTRGYNASLDRPQTIGQMLRFGMTRAWRLRRMTAAVLREIGGILERHGLAEQWYAS